MQTNAGRHIALSTNVHQNIIAIPNPIYMPIPNSDPSPVFHICTYVCAYIYASQLTCNFKGLQIKRRTYLSRNWKLHGISPAIGGNRRCKQSMDWTGGWLAVSLGSENGNANKYWVWRRRCRLCRFAQPLETVIVFALKITRNCLALDLFTQRRLKIGKNGREAKQNK